MKDIRNKLVLITGGASGIGRLLGLDFARRGARVIVWDLNGAAIKKLEGEAALQGLSIKGMVCDIAGREEVYEQAERLTGEYGPLDILVNNAGIVTGLPLLETPDEKIIRTISINALAHFWTVKAFLPGMLERDSGHLVTVTSAAGLIGVAGLSDYSASKFGAFGFHESLRMELRRRKSRIRTTVVCPYFIDTGLFQGVKTKFPLLLPILKPEKVAAAITKAVIHDRQRLIMPPLVRMVFLLRLFPVGLFDAVSDFLGVHHAMDGFTGRKALRPSPGKPGVELLRKAE
ncbi:MAG: SDR family oxidoreductase [Spirochaetaceae bacterium]|jgi:all-trans-retinol dehydrogenase (NAD+)|nr:SDR family oxidoreductase [Spirochaetaceae bacterium]